MDRLILALLLFWGAPVLTATAADLPSKSAEPAFEEPPPIPTFSWSGLYVGVHAGVDLAQDSGVIRLPSGSIGRFGLSPCGIIGGAHTGYNRALAKVFGEHELVAGLEGDVDGADLSRSTSAYGDVLSAKSDVTGSVRGRLGIAASRVLYFATGGLALADLEARYRTTQASANVAGIASDKTVAGYTVGAGVEYAFTNSYAVRAEYRTSRYSALSATLVASAQAAPIAVSHRETDNRLQAGISYRLEPSLSAVAESN